MHGRSFAAHVQSMQLLLVVRARQGGRWKERSPWKLKNDADLDAQRPRPPFIPTPVRRLERGRSAPAARSARATSAATLVFLRRHPLPDDFTTPLILVRAHARHSAAQRLRAHHHRSAFGGVHYSHSSGVARAASRLPRASRPSPLSLSPSPSFLPPPSPSHHHPVLWRLFVRGH